MVKRKKRLGRGIKSLEKQIALHKDKRKKALAEGRLELVEYYSREIQARGRDVNKKKRLKNK